MTLARRIAALLAISIAAAAPIRGQLVEDYRFQGRVLDAGGKPLSGVQIVLRNVETGARIVFATEADGTFDRRMIPHAVYEATFAKPGYVSRTESFDWSMSGPEPIVRQAKVVLESEADRARRELGARAAKLYAEAYAGLAAGDCTAATRKAQELLGLGAGDWEYAVRFVLARCLAMRDSAAAAVAEYRRVLASKPDLFEAHFDLASLLEAQGDHAAALAEYAEAARLHPEDAEAEYNMGVILFRRKDFDAARPHLQRAIELAPQHAQAWKALGFAALQAERRDLDAASRSLARYLELSPQAPDAAQVREIVQSIAAAAPPVHEK